MLLTQIIEDLQKLLLQKREAYGQAFFQSSSIMKALYPKGIPPDQYDNALTILRICDKLFRIANAKHGQDPMNEDPWKDIAGYAILALENKTVKEKQNEPQPSKQSF